MRFISKAIFLLIISLPSLSSAQSLLNSIPVINLQSATLEEAIDHIEEANQIEISYNIAKFQSLERIYFESEYPSLEALLNHVFNNRASYTLNRNRKILVKAKKPSFSFSGTIVDELTGESIPGAAVYILEDQTKGTFSNDKGFFTLAVDRTDSLTLVFSKLGATGFAMRAQAPQKRLKISLNQSISIPDIVISDHPLSSNKHVDETMPFISEASLFPSLLGETDILNSLKKYPQINSGAEAQNGLIVRGGNTDQNLILIDGVPVYEMSHLAGLSSIVVSEAIKSTDFYATGFPAQFSGRLSSVLDIHLKDGNKRKQKGNVQASLLGLKAYLEGPIVEDKTSFVLSGRVSWFDYYLKGLITSNTNLDNVSLKYFDLNAKITHSFSPSNVISISAYKGIDEINVLQNDSNPQELVFNNSNRLEWGNEIINLQWNFAASSKLFINNQVYFNQYTLLSRGSYNYDIINELDQLESREFDAFTFSGIRDFSLSSQFSYYLNNDVKLNTGIKYTKHRYRPNIVQSRFIIPESEFVDTLFDETNYANELSLFVNSEFSLNEKWSLHAGINNSIFNNQRSYSEFQPRLSLQYDFSSNHFFRLSASKMVQFVHLLVNPGIGLPSELWVPSTNDVGPETANEFSASLNLNFENGIGLQLNAFTKEYSGLIDFQESTDIFYYILNEANFVPPFISGQNWESRVVTGEGRARGIEVLARYTRENTKFWASYAYGTSERLFSDINSAEYFPFRYDYRHDLNLGLWLKLSDKLSASVYYVFNTGRRYTLATEVARATDGTLVLIPPKRNNRLFPNFHHLDINFEYKTTLGTNPLSIHAGVYNVYNRYNPYYLFLLEEDSNEFSLQQLSLFPLLPQLSAEFNF